MQKLAIILSHYVGEKRVVAQLKAVIFDVDGTLADTERNGHRVAFNQAFHQVGLDWVWDETLYGQLLAVAGGKERIAYYLSTIQMAFKDEGDKADFIRRLYAEKTQVYMALLASKQIDLRPGVLRLLNALQHSDLRIAIATTTTPENVEALIQNTLGESALSWFDCIAAGDIVDAKKPAPDIFNYCLTELGLKANECIVIEDSENGIQAALAAGIPTLVTMNGYTENDDFSGALSVLDHLGDADLACQVSAGLPILSDMVTVDDLRRLHAKQ